MNSIDTKALKFMFGMPVVYQDICLVYSPLLKKIAAEGLDKFYQYISLLLIEKPELKDEQANKLLKSLSDFEYLFLLAENDEKDKALIRSAFEFFCEEQVTFIKEPLGIVFGPPQEKRILTQETFYGFQDLISLACAMKDATEEDIIIYDDDSPKTKEIKMALIKGRKQRKEIKRKQAQNKDGEKIELSDLVGSLTIGSNSSLNILNVQDLTYYAFQDQTKRMGWYEEFNINTRASLAGAKLDKDKLSHWIKHMSFNS